MGDRFGFRLLLGIALVGALAVVGVYTYNLGLARGIAQSVPLAAPGSGAPVVIWPGPWGFGFGFFPFFPLMILFWIFVARALFWPRPWRGGGCRYDGSRERRAAVTRSAVERTT
jgi:hypothetical protein